MLSIKHVYKSSSRYLSSLYFLNAVTSPTRPPQFSTAAAPPVITHFDFTQSIRDWFKSASNQWLDRIFEILSRENEKERQEQLLLSQLNLPLRESLVLEVLYHGNSTKKDVLSCLKFFDWAGRQHGFYHTRATYHAIFKILKKAKLMSLALDFLDGCMNQKRFWPHKIRFYETLVIGYAVAGKPTIALQLFGQMRFQGLDLDSFSYHVLLNALVEEGCFDAADIISKQMRMKGFENDVTHSILVKCFCRRGLWNEAEVFLRGVLAEEGVGRGHGHALTILVDSLCKNKMFDKAGRLIEEFRSLEVYMKPVYGIWLRDLVQAGMVNEALEFLKSKQSAEGYVPEVFQYNVLLCRLLKENRFKEAWDVFIDMKESQICPNKVTMNAALCLFSKAGMMDVALDIYKSGPELELSVNSVAYNYLIKTLCEYKHSEEAFHVLRNLSKDGYFPDRRTFNILANALCHNGKTDNVMELVVTALERNIIPGFSTYNKLIMALCRAGRVQSAYLIHRDCSRMVRGASRTMHTNMIYSLARSNSGNIAFNLLVEMQDQGLMPSRSLFRAVICSLCYNGDIEGPLLQLLSRDGPKRQIFNLFINGAGHANRPKLARAVFEMMERSGLQPNLNSYILMLQSYLRNGRIYDARDYFNTLREKIKMGKKLYNTMIVGLCKFRKIELTLDYFVEARRNGIVPSMECYEEFIKVLCMRKEYDIVVNLLDDIERVGRNVTSFIGNTLLFHSLTSDELYKTWIRSREAQKKTSSQLSILARLMGEFSGCITTNQHTDDLEEVLEMCFPLDVYTYNILLTKFSRSDMNHAFHLFNRLQERGLEPNRRTYEILGNMKFLVNGLVKHGRTAEAKLWLDFMKRKGFTPTNRTEPNRNVNVE